MKYFLNLHEYQAMELLKHYNLPVLRGGPAFTPLEALNQAQELTDAKGYVIKAQVHSGGRGRGHFLKSKLQGGVQILKTPQEVQEISKKMLGDTLITKQSGEQGKVCKTVFIVEKVNIKSEAYLSIMLDRENACPLIIASPKGGMGIEEIDSKYILKHKLNFKKGVSDEDA